jgi:hypothetical protein
MSFSTHPGNQFFLRIINPYDPIMWDFTIFLPPEAPPEPIEKPEYSIDDFLKTDAVEFLGYVEPGKTLNPLFEAFKSIAISMVNYELVGQDDSLWKHLVSLYIAHNMEMAMARLKNQADEISLTPEKDKEKKIEYSCGNIEGSEFMATKYGFAFWTIYRHYLKFRFWGVYTPRGYNK